MRSEPRAEFRANRAPPSPGHQPLGARLVQQRRRVARAFGRRVAELHIAQARGRHRRDLVNATAAAIEVERIDEQAGVVAGRTLDDARALREIADVRPGHRLQVRADPELGRQVAERCQVIDEAGFVGVVSGDKRFGRTEPRAGFQRRTIERDDRVRLQAKDLDVERANAQCLRACAQSPGPSACRRPSDAGPLPRWQAAGADRRSRSRLPRRREPGRGCQFQHRQCRKRNRTRHDPSGITLSRRSSRDRRGTAD